MFRLYKSIIAKFALLSLLVTAFAVVGVSRKQYPDCAAPFPSCCYFPCPDGTHCNGDTGVCDND